MRGSAVATVADYAAGKTCNASLGYQEPNELLLLGREPGTADRYVHLPPGFDVCAWHRIRNHVRS